MDWGKQMALNQQNARMALYQNVDYSKERNRKQSLILNITETDDSITDYTIYLTAPILIDELSEIYLDSVVTLGQEGNTSASYAGFILDVDQFNIQSNSGNNSPLNASGRRPENKLFRNLFIPNEASGNAWTAHKSKKMNYICDINPSKLDRINLKITNMDGNSIWNSSMDERSPGKLIIELIIVNK